MNGNSSRGSCTFFFPEIRSGGCGGTWPNRSAEAFDARAECFFDSLTPARYSRSSGNVLEQSSKETKP